MSLMLVTQNSKDPRGALGFFWAKEKHTLVRPLLPVFLKEYLLFTNSLKTFRNGEFNGPRAL